MERMTLRDAAERTARSVTTIRRYIRSGRLRAEKTYGRYGPEYVISEEALEAAGLPTDPAEVRGARHDEGALVPISRALREFVPASLYHELQMKHEQLLVQYGMVRVGGLRVLELQGELRIAREKVAGYEAEIAAVREQCSHGLILTKKKLRETELELEGRSLEVAALREKLRGLERIVPGPAAPHEIEHQLSQVADQIRRVERLESARPGEPSPRVPKIRADEPEH